MADVSHPNLVSLYELVSDRQTWFFTMELVDGVDFLTHVRGGDGIAGPDRLREALLQLAGGVCALHRAGKLHRDLKPSNVRVTESGRVVILDFGLAAELDTTGRHQSTDAHVLGTVATWPPSRPRGCLCPGRGLVQCRRDALRGPHRPDPLRRSSLEVLATKQSTEAVSPRDLVADVPEALNALCVELLRREPEGRPLGSEGYYVGSEVARWRRTGPPPLYSSNAERGWSDASVTSRPWRPRSRP